MSWIIRKDDYIEQNKKTSTKHNTLGVPKKRIKLPTKYKTRRKKCALCINLSVNFVFVGAKKKYLCRSHLDQLLRKDFKYDAVFKKANESM